MDPALRRVIGACLSMLGITLVWVVLRGGHEARAQEAQRGKSGDSDAVDRAAPDDSAQSLAALGLDPERGGDDARPRAGDDPESAESVPGLRVASRDPICRRDPRSWDLRKSAAHQRATPDAVSQVALSMIGVPYRYGGTNRAGFDCSGLVSYVYGRFDYELPRTAGAQMQVGLAVDRSRPGSLREGDLVFFSDDPGGHKAGHVGIFIGDGRFVHAATSRRGVLTDSVGDRHWVERLIAARRVLALPPGRYTDADGDRRAGMLFESVAAVRRRFGSGPGPCR